MKKIYTIIWTYIANHGVIRGHLADSPEDAAKNLDSWFSEDFRQKGTIYVFEDQPAFVRERRDGKKY